MSDSGEYAIVDVTRGSNSAGKILVLLDDEQTATEMAADLRVRGCDVVVRRVALRQGLMLRPHLEQEPSSSVAVPNIIA
jgi:hypothetical protein